MSASQGVCRIIKNKPILTSELLYFFYKIPKDSNLNKNMDGGNIHICIYTYRKHAYSLNGPPKSLGLSFLRLTAALPFLTKLVKLRCA